MVLNLGAMEYFLGGHEQFENLSSNYTGLCVCSLAYT